MKVMLLAAGRGERLRPLTDTTPKPLVEVNKESLIARHLRLLNAAGFDDIVINVSHLAEKIISHLGDVAKYSVEEEPLETAGGICLALSRGLLDKNEAFAVINADVFCAYDFNRLNYQASNVAKEETCYLLLTTNPPEHPQGDFSLTADSLLLPPQENGNTHTYTGIGVFHPSLFAKLKAGDKHRMLPLIMSQINKQKATGEILQGLWHDTGTPESLARARIAAQTLEPCLTL